MTSRPDRCQTRQPRLIQRSDHTHSPRCCPIGFEQRQQFEPLPQRRSRHREEPGEAVPPIRQMPQIAQQHVHQQRRIHLPTHGIGTMAQEAGELQALFDLFEEHLNVPAAAIEVAHRARTPRELVGDEHHHPPLIVDLDPGFNAPHLHARMLSHDEGDKLVLDDVLMALGEVFHHAAPHVVLGAGDPPHAARAKLGEVKEVHVSLVEHDDLSLGDARADFPSPLVVVMSGGVHHGKRGQEAVQVQPQVHLGSGLAPTVFGPVHAVGHQLEDGGVHSVDAHLEAPQQPLALPACSEGRAGVLKMAEHRPEEPLNESRVTLLVGVGEGVARRSAYAKAGERRRFEPQPVADIVETDNVCAGWCCFVHSPYRVAGISIRRQPAFLPSHTTLLWDGCENIHGIVGEAFCDAIVSAIDSDISWSERDWMI